MKKLLAILFVLMLASAADATVYFTSNGTASSGGTITNYHGTLEKGYSDSSAPDGDGKVLRWTYPEGLGPTQYGGPGNSVANLSMYVPTGNTREIWIQYYYKYSSNHTFQGVMDKQFYFHPGNTMGAGITVRSDGRLNFVCMPQDPANRHLPNVDSSGFYNTKGVWYKYTGYFKINDVGSANGLYKAWVNDTLIANYTNIRYSDGDAQDNGNYFVPYSLQFVIIWGGISDFIKPETSYLYIDDVYVGDVAPSGDPGEDATPPYLHSFSPADGATGVDNNTSSFTFHAADSGVGIDNVSFNVNGGATKYCGATNVSCAGSSADITVTYTSPTPFGNDNTINVLINARDANSNTMATFTYNFITESVASSTLSLDNCTLPSGTVGTAYSGGTVTATGGTSPYSYDNTAGTVAPGMSVSPTTGLPVGTPTTAGTYNWTLRVTDAVAATDTIACNLIIGPALPGGQYVVEIPASGDTFINKGAASTNYGSSAYLETYAWPAYEPANRILLEFDLSGLPSPIRLDFVTLYLYQNGYEGSGGTNPVYVYARNVTNDFDPATITWNTFDNVLGSMLIAETCGLDNAWRTWNVTSAAVAGSMLRLMLDHNLDGAADTNRRFVSLEGAAEYRPKLVVGYTLLTEPGGPSVPGAGKARVHRMKGSFGRRAQ